MKAKASVALALLVVWLAAPANAADMRSSAAVADTMRVCASDADCVTIDKDCGDCCDFDTIAKSQLVLFEVQKKAQCASPKIACDCIPDKTKKPACVENRCVLTSTKKDEHK